MSKYMEEIQIIVEVGQPPRNMCRACLSTSGTSQSIFVRDGLGINLAEMIMEYSSVQITPGDGLPEIICFACSEKCIELYKFKRKCETSDQTLRRFFGIGAKEVNEQVAIDDTTKKIDFGDGKSKVEPKVVTLDAGIPKGSIPRKLVINNKEITVYKCDSNRNISDGVHNTRYSSRKRLEPQKLKSAEDSNVKVTERIPKQQHECSICNKRFLNITNLYKHKKSHAQAQAQAHVCDICNKTYKTSKLLYAHGKYHKTKSHRCDICSKTFFSISGLKSHVLIHTGEKPFLCTTCGKRFNHASNLRQHVELHSDVKAHVCKECGTSFNSPGKLAFHMKKHTGSSCVCVKCGKGFVSASRLRDHMDRHNGTKGFACTECGNDFASKGELTVHLRQHTGARPYVCPTCNRAFARPDPLQLHMRTHTGEKPYECDVCHQRFARSHERGRHKKYVHASERPGLCKICGRCFKSSIGLNKHMRDHAIEIQEDLESLEQAADLIEDNHPKQTKLPQETRSFKSALIVDFNNKIIRKTTNI